jgi:hypothetical protein
MPHSAWRKKARLECCPAFNTDRDGPPEGSTQRIGGSLPGQGRTGEAECRAVHNKTDCRIEAIFFLLTLSPLFSRVWVSCLMGCTGLGAACSGECCCCVTTTVSPCYGMTLATRWGRVAEQRCYLGLFPSLFLRHCNPLRWKHPAEPPLSWKRCCVIVTGGESG